MVGFPYHLSHHHVYELAGHQLQSASAVPFSIDGLLNGSCTASVGNSNPLLSSGCGMNGDNQQYKLSGKPHYPQHNELRSRLASCERPKQKETKAGCCDKLPSQWVCKAFSPPTSFPSCKTEDLKKKKILLLSYNINSLCLHRKLPSPKREQKLQYSFHHIHL